MNDNFNSIVITEFNTEKNNTEKNSGLSNTIFSAFISKHRSQKLQFAYNLGAEWNGKTPDATGIYTISLAYFISENQVHL